MGKQTHDQTWQQPCYKGLYVECDVRAFSFSRIRNLITHGRTSLTAHPKKGPPHQYIFGRGGAGSHVQLTPFPPWIQHVYNVCIWHHSLTLSVHLAFRHDAKNGSLPLTPARIYLARWHIRDFSCESTSTHLLRVTAASHMVAKASEHKEGGGHPLNVDVRDMKTLGLYGRIPRSRNKCGREAQAF